MKTERLNRFWKIVVVISSLIGVFLSVNMLFYLKLFGINPIQNAFLIYLLACFMPISFLIYPASKKHISIKWYDVLLFAVSLVVIIYLGANGQRIILEGWDWNAPAIPTYFSIVLWALLLEALRRTAGLVLALICLVVSIYPMFASDMPIAMLQGQSL